MTEQKNPLIPMRSAPVPAWERCRARGLNYSRTARGLAVVSLCWKPHRSGDLTWIRPRGLIHGLAGLGLSLTLAGCVSHDLIAWPAPPPGSLPTLTVQPADPPGPASITANQPPKSVRAALPPALVASLAGSRLRSQKPVTAAPPAKLATSGPKRDDQVKVTTSTDPTIPVVISPPVVPPAPMEYPIDLTTALRLAEVENPEIAETRVRIREALAFLQGARALAVPTLNAGTMYHGHTGDLQRSSGRILSLSEQSLYFGGGSRTVAAESMMFPAVNIVSPFADVLFEPLVGAPGSQPGRVRQLGHGELDPARGRDPSLRSHRSRGATRALA